MLNIHSFLRRQLKQYSKCMVFTAYTLTGIMFVLSTDSSYGAGRHYSTVLAKAEEVGSFLAEAEETDRTATIQLDENETQIGITFEERTQQTETVTIVEQKIQEKELEIAEIQAKKVEEAKAAQEAIQKVEAERKAAIKKAEAKKAAAKAAKEKAAAAKKAAIAAEKERAKSYTVNISSEDKVVLQRIVEAEATGEDLQGKVLVACVVLNRVKSKQFPDSVSKVVFQKSGSTYQFSPIKDGRYWSVSISEDTKKAVEKALTEGDKAQGALYFSARKRANKNSMSWFDNHLTWLFKHGNHEFYK